MNLEPQTLETLAEALASIAQAGKVPDRLWDTAAVATYLGLNVDYCRRHIITRGDFPKALHIPGRGTEPIVRYQPDDVREWAATWRA